MDSPSRPRRILFLNWRDTRNPEGGGSEVYVERIASALAAAGDDVTLFCAAHEHAPAEEMVHGVRIVRGGTKLGVYWEALRRYRSGRLGDPDLVVDVQNGIPFFSRLARPRTPVIVLVHHVHREQWPVVYDPVRSRVGWTLESRVSPLLYRGCQYVAVSDATRGELIDLGVHAADIAVVRNGTDAPSAQPAPPDRDSHVIVLGRLVPHKRVELAVDAVLAAAERHPQVRLDIVGDGWWRDELAAYVQARDTGHRVTLHGFVDAAERDRLLAGASVMLLPSLKEGWGLVVMEAAALGVPTIAFHGAGGVEESIVDQVTGLLVDSPAEMDAALDRLLEDTALRQRMGDAARERARSFSWGASVADFSKVVDNVLARRRH